MSSILRFVLSHIQSYASCIIAWCSILYISVAASIDWYHFFTGNPESILVLLSMFLSFECAFLCFLFYHEEYVRIICSPHWNSLWIISQNSLDLASSPPWYVRMFDTGLSCISSCLKKKLPYFAVDDCFVYKMSTIFLFLHILLVIHMWILWLSSRLEKRSTYVLVSLVSSCL